jgi:hypothetical protein
MCVSMCVRVSASVCICSLSVRRTVVCMCSMQNICISCVCVGECVCAFMCLCTNCCSVLMLRLPFALICVCDEVASACCVCRLSVSINVHFAHLPFVSVGVSVVLYTSVSLCVAVCMCVFVCVCWLQFTRVPRSFFSGSQAVVRMSVVIQFVPSLPFLFLFVCV